MDGERLVEWKPWLVVFAGGWLWWWWFWPAGKACFCELSSGWLVRRWSSGCHMQVMIMLIHQLSQDHSKRHLSSPALHLMAALSALPRTIPSSSKKVTVSPWFIQLFPQKSYLPSTFSSIDSPGLGPRDLAKNFEKKRAPFLGDVIQYLVGMFLLGLIPSESFSAPAGSSAPKGLVVETQLRIVENRLFSSVGGIFCGKNQYPLFLIYRPIDIDALYTQ